MDKIFSARVEESVVRQIDSLARRLRTSKKKVIEDAVQNYASQIDRVENSDVFERTCGAWPRKESAGRIVDEVRSTFRRTMGRHRE